MSCPKGLRVQIPPRAPKLMDSRELFKGTANYYAKYRLGYTPEFFNFLTGYYNLEGKRRLLDLGCGTGQLAIPLAKYFKEVIGVDVEMEMLDKATKEAQKARANNIKWVLRKAEDIREDLGVFRLTTLGASFHWMEQKKVLNKIYNLTDKGGGLVIVNNSSAMWKDENGEEWKGVRRRLIEKYLGEKRRAGNSFYNEPTEKFEDLLNNSPFGGFKEWTQDFSREVALDVVINSLYSTSFAARRLFKDKLNDFEKELKSELLKLNPNGIFKEKVRIRAWLARK